MVNELAISAAIVTYNDADRIGKACTSIIENTKKYPLRLTVVDNASSDNSVNIARESGAEIICLNKNVGFGAAHNKLLETELGKYHFVINPDIYIDSDVLSSLVDFMEENPDVVMAMPKILNPDGTEQKLPKEKPTFKRLFLGRISKKVRREYVWADKEINDVVDIDFCTGCFFCIRSAAFKSLGGFDERFFMYLEDVDLTLKAKKIGRVVMQPNVSVVHEWERQSAKSLKYFLIHISSCIKFLLGRR